MSFKVREVKIRIDTNIPEGQNTRRVTLTSDVLTHPTMENVTVSLNTYPYMTNDMIFPDSLFALPYEKRVEFFFNRNKFTNGLVSAFATKPDEHDQVERDNIMLMIRCLFPTQYPVYGSHYSSFDYFIMRNRGINNEMLNVINPFRHKMFSYIKLDGVIYTFTRTVWLDDAANNPFFAEVYQTFMDLYIGIRDHLANEGQVVNTYEIAKTMVEIFSLNKGSSQWSTSYSNFIRRFLNIASPFVNNTIKGWDKSWQTVVSNMNLKDYEDIRKPDSSKPTKPDNATLIAELKGVLVSKKSPNDDLYFRLISICFTIAIDIVETIERPPDSVFPDDKTRIAYNSFFFGKDYNILNIGALQQTQITGGDMYLVDIMGDFIEGEVTTRNKRKFTCKFTNNKLGNLIENVYQRPLRERKFKRLAVNDREPLFSITDGTMKTTSGTAELMEVEGSDVVRPLEQMIENPVFAALLESVDIAEGADQYMKSTNKQTSIEDLLFGVATSHPYAFDISMDMIDDRSLLRLQEIIRNIEEDVFKNKNTIDTINANVDAKRTDNTLAVGEDIELNNKTALLKFQNVTLDMVKKSIQGGIAEYMGNQDNTVPAPSGAGKTRSKRKGGKKRTMKKRK